MLKGAERLLQEETNTSGTGQSVRRHTSHDRYTAVNRKQGIGCLAKRVLKVSGCAVPAETRSPFNGCTLQHETAAAQPDMLQPFASARRTAERSCSGLELLNVPSTTQHEQEPDTGRRKKKQKKDSKIPTTFAQTSLLLLNNIPITCGLAAPHNKRLRVT